KQVSSTAPKTKNTFSSFTCSRVFTMLFTAASPAVVISLCCRPPHNMSLRCQSP
ncbi:hypothetical protein A2U01_0073721, partial [Trifolium medium]|nr:hypothetical protein [Trifolium medium]